MDVGGEESELSGGKRFDPLTAKRCFFCYVRLVVQRLCVHVPLIPYNQRVPLCVSVYKACF